MRTKTEQEATAGSLVGAPRSLSFFAQAHVRSRQERCSRTCILKCRQAIEDVYWRHRIWPRGGGERPDPKPSLDAVMSQAQLETDAGELLATAHYGCQLQTEMERMAQHTQQPDMLRELFEALGNDTYGYAYTPERTDTADASDSAASPVEALEDQFEN